MLPRCLTMKRAFVLVGSLFLVTGECVAVFAKYRNRKVKVRGRLLFIPS